MREIHLPAVNMTVPLSSYVRAVRLAKENPNAEFKHGLTTWWPVKGREIIWQFRQGMQERINQAIPYSDRGKEY